MPPEGRNNPIGEAKGIFPGRVVWTQDFDATSWDGKTGTWWGDNNTSQVVTDKMISETLKNVTGEKRTKNRGKSCLSIVICMQEVVKRDTKRVRKFSSKST